MESVRIAVIGTGWIAEQIYLPCLLDHGGIEVVAADDPSPQILTRFARLANLGPESLGLAACFSHEIDGLLLCTPPAVHPNKSPNQYRWINTFCVKNPCFATLQN